MNWEQLLNKGRLGHRDAKDETGRTAFLRDHDKIIFSGVGKTVVGGSGDIGLSDRNWLSLTFSTAF